MLVCEVVEHCGRSENRREVQIKTCIRRISKMMNCNSYPRTKWYMCPQWGIIETMWDMSIHLNEIAYIWMNIETISWIQNIFVRTIFKSSSDSETESNYLIRHRTVTSWNDMRGENSQNWYFHFCRVHIWIYYFWNIHVCTWYPSSYSFYSIKNPKFKLI